VVDVFGKHMTETPTPLHIASVFAGAFTTICLELLFTRVLAFVFWNHVVYLIISLALLGYGISSTFITVFSARIRRIPPNLFFSANLVLCAASSALALFCLHLAVAVARPAGAVGSVPSVVFAALPLLTAYPAFLLPFFFCGNVLVGIFYAYPTSSNRLYAWDLAGAAVGCLAFVPTLSISGAVAGVFVVLLPTAALAFFLACAGGKAIGATLLKLFSFVALAGVGVCLHFHGPLFRIAPDGEKSLGAAMDQKRNPWARHDHTAWDVAGRLDIASVDVGELDLGWVKFNPDAKLVTFDGDAISQMAAHPASYPSTHDIADFMDRDLHVPFFQGATGGDHLIIGLGGGVDIDRSLLMSAKTITGVDINGAIIRAMTSDFSSFSGGIFTRPQVSIHNSEGRSFLRRSERKFDLIQMTGVDTYTAMNAGAYVLAENYLYTIEALRDYYSHLSDHGILCIHRWFYDAKPRESLRLFATAIEALRLENVPSPELHLAVVKSGLGILFVRKRPFSAAETASIEHRLEGRTRVVENFGKPPEPADLRARAIYLPGLAPGPHPAAEHYYRLVSAFREGTEEAFFRDYEFDVKPVGDDRPFFFNYHKASGLAKALRRAAAEPESANPGLVQGYRPYIVFLLILLCASAAVCVFIFGPLLVFKREGLKTGGSAWLSVYFAALGAGFMMIEIALMQKFALLLGHPMLSISAVLGGMLLFAGAGSLVSERWKSAPAAALGPAVAVLAVAILLFRVASPLIMDRLLGAGLAVRVSAVLLMLAPLAGTLGVFFPLGLRLAGDRAPEFIPWAWGINSGFTVIGSIVSIMLAMKFGFNAVLLLAGAIYALGYVAVRRYRASSNAGTAGRRPAARSRATTDS
jgi:spermidine synthase